MATTDLFSALRRFARELWDTNSGDPVIRGELAGFFDALATEGSTVTEVIAGNPQELGGEDYPGNPFDVPENNDDDERHTEEPDLGAVDPSDSQYGV